MPSVIIPAHNEEAVIGRCLRSLLAGAPLDMLEVIVVANGCTDGTVAVAQSFGPAVRVISLARACKHEALNAGDAAATRFPRAFVDADIEVTWRDIVAVCDRLICDGALVGAPRMVVDFGQCPWYVKSFYRVWLTQPWRSDGPVGSGVYVISERGHARLGRFPPITNDDQYVHDLFVPHERCVADTGIFVVRPPRTFRDLIARRTRTLAGAAELESMFGRLPGRARHRGPAQILRESPRLAVDLPIYIAVTAVARHAASRRPRTPATVWERDDSSRRDPEQLHV
jgi:hypothetical protein